MYLIRNVNDDIRDLDWKMEKGRLVTVEYCWPTIATTPLCPILFSMWNHIDSDNSKIATTPLCFISYR